MSRFFSVLLAIGMLQLIPSSSRAVEENNENLNKKAPVRISRVELRHDLIGAMSLETQGQESNAEPLEYESSLNWIEEPTQLPPPQEGALADFRDFRGCLQFQALDSVAVCFNVMPDVSSVGVNSREMSLQGIERFVSEELDVEVNDLRLVQAVRLDDSVQMTFSGHVESDKKVLVKLWITPQYR